MADQKMVYKIQGMGEFGEKWDYFNTWPEAEAAITNHTRHYPDKPLSIVQVPYEQRHERPKPDRSVKAQLYLMIQLIKAKQAYPDLRTGQIIGNALNNRDPYYIEDLDMADAIHDWLKQLEAEAGK